jgi:hypothetical protein
MLTEEYELRLEEYWVLREIFGHKRKEERG